jgi:phospholipase/lecithinase/hemolysin
VIRLASLTWLFLLFGGVIFSTSAAFNSLYVFGDGVCTTTDNIQSFPLSTNYYGQRYCNGRVWVEVLAQRQGLSYDSNKNQSYFGCNSSEMVTNVNNFSAPADATNALVVVWVSNADLYDAAFDNGVDLSLWTAVINRAQTNHFTALTNLFAKGVRTLVLPNAVDVARVPAFNGYTTATNFIRQRCLEYNVAFSNTVNQVRAACPGVKIFIPDIFTLLDNMLAHPEKYQLTNKLQNGLSIDALSDVSLTDVSLNGPGTNYIFWDPQDPTAKVHEIIADTVQLLISPMRIRQVAPVAGNTRVDIGNLPIGLSGYVYARTNLTQTNWVNIQTFSSTNSNQSVVVPATGTRQFYQVRFPFAWSWP